MIGYEDDYWLIAKATESDDDDVHLNTFVTSTDFNLMERIYAAAKKKLVGSSNSISKQQINKSKDLCSETNELHYTSSTRTRQTTVSSLQLQLDNSNKLRPESDEEIFELYVQAMHKLGVDVEKVPSLKGKTADEMWQMICTAGLQERDDRNTPEFFANTLANEEKNAHLNISFLKSLRIELGSKPLSWNDDFARFGGWSSVLEALKRVISMKQIDIKLAALRELMKIYRSFTNNKLGMEYVFGDSKRAMYSLEVIVSVFSVPCMQSQLAALESILMASLIEDSRLVPVIVEAFRKENNFARFTTVFTEAFNSIRSIKDQDYYTFLLDSMLLVNTMIGYGYEIDDLEFRMKLRSNLFSTDLKKSFNRYKIVGDERLTLNCELYLSKAHSDATEFMARFDKNEQDLKTPLSLMETVAEVFDEDELAQDALLGLLTKMLLLASNSPERLKYISAVDSLIDEVISISGGYSVDLMSISFKDKEEKALNLTIKKKYAKMEEQLLHAKKQAENLTNIQNELEAHIEVKGQRILTLAQEKNRIVEEAENLKKEHEVEIQRLKNELEAKENEIKQLSIVTAQMSNFKLDSPNENNEIYFENNSEHTKLTFSHKSSSLTSTENLESTSSSLIGVNLNALPPPPMPKSFSNAPPPPPMPNNFLNVPPPPPMPISNSFSGVPPPPPMPFSGIMPKVPILVCNKPKPVGKTRQLQWEKLNQINGTIWENIDDSKWETMIDYADLENTFKYDPVVFKQTFPEERRISFSTSGSALMDPKKARNMQIILGRLRLTPQELRTSLLRMDENIWSDSIAHEIMKYLPNKSEKEQIARNYEDLLALETTKATAERIAFELSKIVGLEDRLCSIELMTLIGDWHIEALEQLDSLLKGLEEVKAKDSLKDFLELVLATGNFLNSGTYKANATGFKIDSLLKIRDMKTTEGKSNLLVYLLDFLQKNKPDLMNLPSDIKNVVPASKISLDGMTEILAEKKRFVYKLEKFAENYKLNNFEDLNGVYDRYLVIIEPFLEEAKKHVDVVEEKLNRAIQEFTAILKLFGDDGDFKTPQDLFSIFTSFSADFERIKQEMLMGTSEETDLKKKISGVLKYQEKEGRNLIDNILDAARTVR